MHSQFELRKENALAMVLSHTTLTLLYLIFPTPFEFFRYDYDF